MATLYYYLDKRNKNKSVKASLRIALSHNRQSAYLTLGIHIDEDEWDASKAQVIKRPDRKFLNVLIRKRMTDSLMALQRVELRPDFQRLSAKEVMNMIARGGDTVDSFDDFDYVVPVYNEYITLCKKASTASLYRYSLNNLKEYEPNIDSLTFRDMNDVWVRKYQLWLTNAKGMETNGANVYLRNLRAIFNFALRNGYTQARYPFKGGTVDMSTREPDKRDVAYEKFLEWATIPMPDGRAFYRDIFMLSFYLCGIRPVDLLHVKKEQVQDGRLVYFPEKLNGKTKLSIKIEPEAWELIHKYEGKDYLIDVMETRSDYKSFLAHVNAALRAIGQDETMEKIGRNGKHYQTIKHHGIVPYITIYYARTCWATYQYNIIETPMDIISQAMGHKSGLKVTNFYVKRDTAKADKANRDLIDRVTQDMAEYAQKKGWLE